MNSKRKKVIIALLIGVAAFMANSAYISSVRDESAPKKLQKVVVARKRIPVGTPLSARLVKTVRVPEKYKPKVALGPEELQGYLGQMVSVPVAAGDYLLQNYFEEREIVGDTLSKQLAEKGTEKNIRAISLSVDDINSLSRSIEIGDHIDILFTFTPVTAPAPMSVMLLQNVPVISTGTYSQSEQERGGRQSRRYNSLTLALNATDAAKLNYARQTGKISILLRGQKDDTAFALEPITNVVDLLSPEEQAKVQKMTSVTEAIQSAKNEKLRNQLKEALDLQKQQSLSRDKK